MALTTVGGTCPNCGGKLEHKGKGKMVCPFCDAEFFDESVANIAKDQEADDEEEFEPKSDEEIDQIVRDAIKEYVDENAYGVQVSLHGERMSKENKARDNFDIDDDDTIYMIYDETFLGSCKDGYALTDSGLYYSYDDCGDVYIPWDEFDEVEIDWGDGNAELCLDDDVLTITAGDACDFTHDLLEEIQDRLTE